MRSRGTKCPQEQTNGRAMPKKRERASGMTMPKMDGSIAAKRPLDGTDSSKTPEKMDH
jgi:hypothetical protein